MNILMLCNIVNVSVILYGGIVDYKRREIPDLVPIVLLLTGLLQCRSWLDAIFRFITLIAVAALLYALDTFFSKFPQSSEDTENQSPLIESANPSSDATEQSINSVIPGGDFKLISALAFSVGLYGLTAILLPTFLLALITAIIPRKHSIPLCTYVSVANTLYCAIQFIL